MPRSISGRWGTAMVGLGLSPGGSMEQGSTSTPPSATTAAHIGLDRWNRDLDLLIWEQRRFVTKGTEEGRL